MSYLRKFSSLKERSSAQLAVNLCQENDFKEVALCLEKPTYGALINEYASSFVTDPEILSTWAKMKQANAKQYDRLFREFIRSCHKKHKDGKERWDVAINEQCQRLTKGLPRSLMHGVHAWIKSIALEYLSYSRRQEALFGVSRYFLMDVLTTGDWTEGDRLDEEKVAKRLLEDERLTVSQRYRIACVYCLHANISQLWKILPHEEQINELDMLFPPQEIHNLVWFWSCQMNPYRMETLAQRENHIWTYAAEQSVHYGNRAALMSCWKRLKEDIRQRLVIDMALKSVQKWQSMLYAYGRYIYNREKLFDSEWPSSQSHESLKHFNLPPYYTELMHFFLSEMDEEQQLGFFKEAFKSKYCDSILESFLDWPHQDDFLPTINRLWGIVPKDKYEKCLFTLVSKCSGDDEKETRYYDYRNLLSVLWENTPEEYKQFVFCERDPVRGHYSVLPCLLKISPFREIDETLFKRFFYDQPQEKRRAMMRSDVGEDICSTLTQKENLSFLNWLLQECLPKEEIPSYKKQFIQSHYGQKLCISKLEEGRKKLVEDLIDWCFTLDTEKTQYKYELIKGDICLDKCKTSLIKENFNKVERLINFCLSSGEMKEQFKVQFARHTFRFLIKKCEIDWERMDKIVAWTVDEEEKISDRKKDIFSYTGVYSHYKSVFIYRTWKEVERFYEWFNLSPEEIKKLKKDTIFAYPPAMEAIKKSLFNGTVSYVEPLRYCLTDRKMVLKLEKTIKETSFNEMIVVLKEEVGEGESLKKDLYIRQTKAKKRLDDLVRELLYSCKKDEVQVKTRREDVFINDKGEKRSSTATKSKSRRKRFK